MKKGICILACIVLLLSCVCFAAAEETDRRFIPPEEAIGMTEEEMMNQAVALLTDTWRYGGSGILTSMTYNGPWSRCLSEEGYFQILHAQICYLDRDYASREKEMIRDKNRRSDTYGVYCMIDFSLLTDPFGTAPYYMPYTGMADEVVVLWDGSMFTQPNVFLSWYVQRLRVAEIPRMMVKVVQTDAYNAVYCLRDRSGSGPEKPAEEETATEEELRLTYPLTDEYRELILQYSKEYNLYPGMIAAVIRAESSFRPDADASGRARGLMQLTPETAGWIAAELQEEDYSFDMMFDPDSNVRYGCWYLSYLRKMFDGDPVCMIAAYHAGQKTVQSWLSDPEISEDGVTIAAGKIPDEMTKQYVQRVLKGYWYYEKLYDWYGR